jgi:nicotinamide riboside kinase
MMTQTPQQKLEAAINEYLDWLRDSNFPKKSKTLVVNMIGGPGTGKSILASDTFSALKKKYITCDISHEYIKRKLREKAIKVTQDQIYIFGKQQFQLFGMIDDVLVIVTDSPILLSAIYPIESNSKCPLLKGLILKEYLSYNNIMYFIDRDEKAEYETEGRYQDLEGAKKVDLHVKKFLEDNKIEYKTVKGIGTDSLEAVLRDVCEKLSIQAQ